MKYDSEEYRKFKEERIAAGRLIDPATAEAWCGWLHDDYGVFREYFFRAPDSNSWVRFDDLPENAQQEARQLIEAGYYYPEKRAERLLQRLRTMEAQLKIADELLDLLGRETAKSELAEGARQLRLELAQTQTAFGELRRVVASAAEETVF